MADKYTFDRLAAYLQRVMEERGFESQRAFARHYDLPRQTLRRLLSGQRVDPESLNEIATALSLPVETFFRLCGYLPTEEARSALLDEVEALLRGLDRDAQRRVRDIVREEVVRLQDADEDEGADYPAARAG
jgi:transcriptional regulator with XRE-family HTH domain